MQGMAAPPMPPKKRLEELDAELAALEAELAALETGAGAKTKKREAPPEEAPAEAPPEPAPKRKLGRPKPKPEAAPEAPAAEPVEKPKRKRGLALPRRKEAPAQPGGAPAATEGGPVAGAPAEEPRKRRLPFGRAAEEAPPAAAPPQAPEQARVAWQPSAGGWRALPPGPRRVEVVRRHLDEAGRVLAEEQVGEEVVEAPPAEEPPTRRFGLRRAEAPAEPGAEAPAEPAKPKRGRLILIPVLIVAALLALAVLLPAVGVDPLGTGQLFGTGGGGPLPVASFAVSANIVAVGAPVAFDARPSQDPAGGALEHSWDFGDGSGAQGAQVTHTYSQRGTYTVTLTARNSAGRTGTHTESITVLAPPVARVAVELHGSPVGGENSPVADEALSFDASGSTAEGGIVAYDWSFGDGARATGARAEHSYAGPGSYRVTVVVADGNGLRGNASVAVYVGLREATAGQAPASVQGAQAVNRSVAVEQGGGALPFKPIRLRATLTWNATTPAPGPLPLPGGLNPDALRLTVYDAAGASVASSAGDGASPQEAVVEDFTGALGAWNVEVARPQGGAQDLPYTLEVELLNGAA